MIRVPDHRSPLTSIGISSIAVVAKIGVAVVSVGPAVGSTVGTAIGSTINPVGAVGVVQSLVVVGVAESVEPVESAVESAVVAEVVVGVGVSGSAGQGNDVLLRVVIGLE